MTERAFYFNNALYAQFGQLVIFFDGARLECGVIGEKKMSTVWMDANRERLRVMLNERQKRKRAKKRALVGPTVHWRKRGKEKIEGAKA